MSIHPSLSSVVKGKKQRTVLKRKERIKYLIDKEKWSEESKVYGLPKIKITRIKIKKEKVEKPKEEAVATTTTETKTAAKTATPADREKSKNQ